MRSKIKCRHCANTGICKKACCGATSKFPFSCLKCHPPAPADFSCPECGLVCGELPAKSIASHVCPFGIYERLLSLERGMTSLFKLLTSLEQTAKKRLGR